MKKIITILALVMLGTSFTNAQESKKAEEQTSSKTLEFMQKDGTFMLKEFYDLQTIKGVELQVLILTDVVGNKKMGCLRLTTKYSSSYSSDEYTGTLDYDEIDACLKSLSYLKDNILDTAPNTYTEVRYKTRDNVQIGAFYGSGKWSAYVQTKGYSSRSISFFDTTNLEQLAIEITKAKNMIAEKVK